MKQNKSQSKDSFNNRVENFSFFKPTRWTFVYYLIFVMIIYILLLTTNIKIFPCKIRPLILSFTDFHTDSYCGVGFNNATGIEQTFTAGGYFLLIIIIFLLPYILACLANYFIKKE